VRARATARREALAFAVPGESLRRALACAFLGARVGGGLFRCRFGGRFLRGLRFAHRLAQPVGFLDRRKWRR
jgi:hypothetical protein